MKEERELKKLEREGERGGLHQQEEEDTQGLTGKNPGGMGPPGPMPSLGGICPMGDGAGPAFCGLE